MDVGSLWAFEAAVRVGESHRVAAKRNPVQSGVASRLRLLEEGLETPVFRHHSRAVTLTTVGRRLLPYAQCLPGRWPVSRSNLRARFSVSAYASRASNPSWPVLS